MLGGVYLLKQRSIHVEIMRAGIGTGFHDRRAIQMERPDGVNDQTSFSRQSMQFIFFELHDFHAYDMSVTVAWSHIKTRSSRCPPVSYQA